MNSKVKQSIPDYILALCFAAVIILIASQVVFRYVLNNSLTWTEELSRYLFTWIVFLGAALAIRDRLHIKVELFIEMLPEKMYRVLEKIHLFLIALFLEILIIIGGKLVILTAGTTSPALGLPVNLVYYAALPATFLIGLWFTIGQIINRTDAGEAKDVNTSKPVDTHHIPPKSPTE